jgi:hypothetical protein
VTTGAKQHKKEVENQAGKLSNCSMQFLIINMVFAFVLGCWFGNKELREELQSARNLNKQIVESLSKETFWFYNFKSRYETEDSQNKKLREELEKARRLNKEIVESLSEEKVWYYNVRSSVSKNLEKSRAFALKNEVEVLKKQIKSRNDTLFFFIQSNFEKEVESLKNQIKTFERELDQTRVSNEASEKKLRNQLDASKKLHGQHLDTVKKEFSKVTNQYFYIKSNYEKERALAKSLEKEVEALKIEVEDLVFGISELLLKETKKRANSNNENPIVGKNCEVNIDECSENPCCVHGTCTDKINSYKCVCETGYFGLNCDSQTPPCPTSDPNYHVLNDHCIFLEKSNKNYEDAKQNCETKFDGHGKLFEPKTWSENQMAYKIAKSIRSNWWIGVNDKQTEGSFVYESNGSPLSYTPKFYSCCGYGSKGTSKNCIIYASPSSGHESDIVHWADYSCTDAFYSICENSN